MQAVSASFLRHVGQAQSVVVGFSGGLDSTVLLHASSQLADSAGIGISAIHVNHGLSENACSWAKHCETKCLALGIPLNVVKVDVPGHSGEGVEAAARRVRHEVFADHPADFVLLGHHADDQAETVLHNLMRGAGIRGAAGMPEARGRVLRPLLKQARKTLHEYAQIHQLTWIEDESNADLRYTRNFFRSEVFPIIAARFPRASEQLSAAAARFGEAEALLEELARLDLGDNYPEFPVSLNLIRSLSDNRARNLLRAMLAWNKAQPPDERRLNEFLRQLRESGRDRHPSMSLERYSLWCEDENLCFKSQN